VNFVEKGFMTSEEFHQLIPNYLSGQLSAAEKTSFEAQLSKDPDLRIEVAELQSTWEELALLPEEQPSSAVRARFYQKLNDINQGRARPFAGGFAWWKPGLSGLVRQVAMALLLFGLGLYVGRSNLNDPASKSEVTQLHNQVQDLRRTVALSLLERQSPTSRLEGVSWSTQVDRPDPELLSALSDTLNHDSNVNVRLSALDALEKFSSEATVRKTLVNAIRQQDSPLVQIALIDALVHIRDDSAAGELKKLTSDNGVNTTVQQRARWGLEKLRLN
jgi:HEAT repeats